MWLAVITTVENVFCSVSKSPPAGMIMMPTDGPLLQTVHFEANLGPSTANNSACCMPNERM